MSYDYESPQEEAQRKRREAESRRSNENIIDVFMIWPLRFFFKNLPAIIPAWVVTFCLLPDLLDAMGLSGFSFAFGMLVGLFSLTGIFWGLLTGIHNFALKLESEIARNSIAALVLGYVFLAYGGPVYFMLDKLTEWHIAIIIGIALLSATAGVGFYLDRIRKDVGAFVANEHLAETAERHAREIEQEKKGSWL